MRERHAALHHMLGIETGIDGHDLGKTPDEQSRPDQQDQRQRDLPDHQGVAQQPHPATR